MCGRPLLLILFVIASFSYVSDPAADGSYDYHIASPLTLGQGFDPKYPLRIFSRKCLTSKGSENIDTTAGAVRVDIKTTIVQSREEFYQATGVSAQLEAHYQFFSGSSSFSSSNIFSSSEDALTWIVRAELIFGRYRMIEPQLVSEIASLTEDPSKFSAACGSEFAAQEVRGIRALVIYNARQLSKEKKQKLVAEIQASYSGVEGSASGSSQYYNYIRELRKTATIDYTYLTMGGPGPEVLGSAITDVDDPIKLRQGLADYLVKTTPENATPLKFETASFSQFGVALPGEMMAHRDNVLAQMNYRYQDVRAVTDRIYSFIRPDPSDGGLLRENVTQKERVSLEEQGKLYEARANEIYAQAQECLEKISGCIVPSVTDLPQINYPTIASAPRPEAVFRCETMYVYDRTSPPGPTKVMGKMGLLVALIGEAKVEKVTINIYGTQVTSESIIDIFSDELPNSFNETSWHPDKALNRAMGYLFTRFSEAGLCMYPSKLEHYRNIRQWALFTLDQRHVIGPVSAIVTDVYGRTVEADLPKPGP